MNSTHRKTGRPRKPHKGPDGKSIDGLRRLSDGRWLCVDWGQKFTEPDERLAIARFRQLEAARAGKSVTIIATVATLRGTNVATPRNAGEFVDRVQEAHAVARAHGAVPRFDYAKNPNDWLVEGTEPDAMLWAWLREQLIVRPQYVAERVGIEQIGWLSEMKRPTPSPTLDEIGTTYKTHAKLRTNVERNNSERWWKEFSEIVGVRTLRELTTAKVAEYHDEIMESGLGAVSIGHRFGKVKTIINFARKRGWNSTDCREALDACAVLVAPSKAACDPKPIERDDFHKLLKTARESDNDRMVAAMPVALNACMYAKDLADLTWGDIKGDVIVTTRSKTLDVAAHPVRRAAVLWPQTVEALAAIKPVGAESCNHVFGTTTAGRFRKLFAELRDRAHVDPEIKFNQIRDGAYTTAVEGDGVEFQHAQVLGGHRCGIADKYIARRPRMVEKACAAIRVAYFE